MSKLMEREGRQRERKDLKEYKKRQTSRKKEGEKTSGDEMRETTVDQAAGSYISSS